jgi:hypothetical protein
MQAHLSNARLLHEPESGPSCVDRLFWGAAFDKGKKEKAQSDLAQALDLLFSALLGCFAWMDETTGMCMNNRGSSQVSGRVQIDLASCLSKAPRTNQTLNQTRYN